MYRILVAEDEMIERMVLKKTLQKRFDGLCEVLEAENGKEALRLFRSEDIHIVILDIEMPGMKGVDVAEIMRQEKNGFCIIFLTAYDRFEYARKAISVRAMEYLLKPYSEKEIIDVVEEAKKLLMQPTVNVKEVGIRVGYPDSTYFARVFRRMTGESPTEYRMRFLKEL